MRVSGITEYVQWDNTAKDQNKVSVCLCQQKVNKCLYNSNAHIFDLFICFISNCDGQQYGRALVLKPDL